MYSIFFFFFLRGNCRLAVNSPMIWLKNHFAYSWFKKCHFTQLRFILLGFRDSHLLKIMVNIYFCSIFMSLSSQNYKYIKTRENKIIGERGGSRWCLDCFWVWFLGLDHRNWRFNFLVWVFHSVAISKCLIFCLILLIFTKPFFFIFFSLVFIFFFFERRET